MKDVREKKDFCKSRGYSFVKGSRKIYASYMFWKLWPSDIDEDVVKINKGVAQINNERKDRFQRCIKEVTKSEYIIIVALLIEASINKMQGIKLWFDGRADNRVGLSLKVDFADYMKRSRFW